MRGLTKTKRAIWMLSVLFLVGCVHFNQETGKALGDQDHGLSYSRPKEKDSNSKEATTSETDAVLRFIATAETGKKRWVRNERTGGSATIIAGDFYHAASGHLCRYYSWSTSDPATNALRCTPNVACRDNEGDWYTVRRIINLDWLSKHMPACLQNTRARQLDHQGRLEPASGPGKAVLKPVLFKQAYRSNRTKPFVVDVFSQR